MSINIETLRFEVQLNKLDNSQMVLSPLVVGELLDHLEAAESDGLEQARLLGMSGEREAALLSKLEAAEKERDELRAEIDRMKKQEPVATTAATHKPGEVGYCTFHKETPFGSTLYALPGAQPAPSVPDEDAAYSAWFHGEQGVAYDGMWAFAKAAWMARAALNAAPKPEGE